MSAEYALSIKDANGRHISLLNTHQRVTSEDTSNTHYFSCNQASPATSCDPSPRTSPRSSPRSSPTLDGRRKYRCTEQGCNKSFTTSGHLARHNRIHTGEKNFYCRYPGCPSRFSRQDNMMQHYRTHLSPKPRRLRPAEPRQPSHAPRPCPQTPVLIPPRFEHTLAPPTCPPVVLPQLTYTALPFSQPKLAPLEPQKVATTSDRNLLSPNTKVAPSLLHLAHIVSTFG